MFILSHDALLAVLDIQSLLRRMLQFSALEVVESIGDRHYSFAYGLYVGTTFLWPDVIKYLPVALKMNEHGTIVALWI